MLAARAAVSWMARGTSQTICHRLLSALSPEGLELQLLTSPNFSGVYCGPLRVEEVSGKGRGLVAARDVRPGELLLLCQPLETAFGPVDCPPNAGKLSDAFKARPLSSEQRFWLERLSGGPLASAPATLAELQQRLGACNSPEERCAQEAGGQVGSSRSSSSSSSYAGDGASRGMPPGSPGAQLDADAVVAVNAFGDNFDDLAAARVRGAAPCSHVGLWPRFSLLNHSCAPNALHYVVGHTMVVRAATAIAAGKEVSVSYLGREDLSPVRNRQALLRQRYGFTCSCKRCAAEGALPAPLRALLEGTYGAVQGRLMPAFSAAAERGELAATLPIAKEAQALSEQLLAALREARQAAVHSAASSGRILSGQQSAMQQVYALASTYGLLELLAMHADIAGGEDGDADAAKSYWLCRMVMEGVGPGSELHVFLACKSAALAAELSTAAAAAEPSGSDAAPGGDSEPRQADDEFSPAAPLLQPWHDMQVAVRNRTAAHQARYGSDLPPRLFDQLVEANMAISNDILG